MESEKSPVGAEESDQKVEESSKNLAVESSEGTTTTSTEAERPSSTNSGKSDEIKTVEGGETVAEPLSLSSSSPKVDPKKGNKINILLKAVGDAPILKQKLWAVDPEKQIASILQFIKSYLKGEANLFLFVNQAFAPSPDQTIKNLYDCFGSDGKLVLHYSTTVAWG